LTVNLELISYSTFGGPYTYPFTCLLPGDGYVSDTVIITPVACLDSEYFDSFNVISQTENPPNNCIFIVNP
jgi:hypothetical protein